MKFICTPVTAAQTFEYTCSFILQPCDHSLLQISESRDQLQAASASWSRCRPEAYGRAAASSPCRARFICLVSNLITPPHHQQSQQSARSLDLESVYPSISTPRIHKVRPRPSLRLHGSTQVFARIANIDPLQYNNLPQLLPTQHGRHREARSRAPRVPSRRR